MNKPELLFARHADLVRVMMRRKLTDLENAEMITIECEITALSEQAEAAHYAEVAQ